MNRHLYLAAVSLAAALVAALSASAGRSAGETPGLIAFTRADGIFVIRADGSGERPLIRRGVAAGANRLAWSPDGRRVAFTNKNAIWAMDADGSHVKRLVGGTDVGVTLLGSLSWSPNGRRVAFTGFQRKANGAPHNWQIWVVDADSGTPRLLRNTPRLWELDVDWSPVTGRIAFTDWSRGGMFGPLRVTTAKENAVRVIDPGTTHNTAMPDWAPDGRTLTYIRWPNRMDEDGAFDEAEVWVTTPAGAAQQLTRNTASDTSPAWSPDGRKIAFLRDRGGTLFVAPPRRSRSELYVMNADGTGVTRLTHNQTAEGSPAWQPDASS